MPSYSEERKAAVLRKMLPPHNLSISEVSGAEGISPGTLYNWRSQAKQQGMPVPGNGKKSDNYLEKHRWRYVSKTWARKGWERWLSWAMRSRLEPIKKVAKTIKEHLWGILNAIILKISNGPAEGINSRIKMIKVRSRGFRNKQRFANAIYFHLGGLDLYPKSVAS